MAKNNKTQFVFNAANGWIAQFSLMATGVILLPYVISRLGPEGYGFFRLGRSAFTFLMFLQLGMGPTLIRFCSQAIACKDEAEIAHVSSTGQLFLGTMGLLGMLTAIGLIPAFLHFYEVPDWRDADIVGMLICMAASLLVTFLSMVPQGLLSGANRYDLANALETFVIFLQLGMVIATFELIRPSLLSYGLCILAAQSFRLVCLFGLAVRVLGPKVLFSRKQADRGTLKKIGRFGFLSLANAVAATVFFEGPVLVIGKCLGTPAVAAFAPALLAATSLRGFLGRFSGPLAPLASRDMENKQGSRLGVWSAKLGQTVAIVGFGVPVLLFTFGPELVGYWLGDDLRWAWSLVAVMATCVAISQIQSVNYSLALGGGDIRPTVISQVVMAVLALSGTVLGTAYWNWDLLAVALFLGVCLMLRNTLYLSYAYAKQFSSPFFQFQYRVYLIPAIVTAACIAVGLAVKHLFVPLNLWMLISQIVVILGMYTLLCWAFVLPEEVKALVPTLRRMKRLPLSK